MLEHSAKAKINLLPDRGVCRGRSLYSSAPNAEKDWEFPLVPASLTRSQPSFSGPQLPRWSKRKEKKKIRIQSALFNAMGRNLHLNFIFVLSLAKTCPPSGE